MRQESTSATTPCFCTEESATSIRLKSRLYYYLALPSYRSLTPLSLRCNPRLYLRALELYPQHSSINLKYAGFLRHTRRDIPGAEKFYLKAVEVSPNNADALGSYASFMHGVHNNIKEAEKYYQKAVEADDTHTNNLCNYGLFLR